MACEPDCRPWVAVAPAGYLRTYSPPHLMPEITYSRYDGADAADQLDEFAPAYEEIYAEPPYLESPRDVAEFIEHYAVQARRPGMRLVLAREGDEVVGFTYGYYLAPDTRWWANLQDVQLPDEVTREDGVGARSSSSRWPSASRGAVEGSRRSSTANSWTG